MSLVCFHSQARKALGWLLGCTGHHLGQVLTFTVVPTQLSLVPTPSCSITLRQLSCWPLPCPPLGTAPQQALPPAQQVTPPTGQGGRRQERQQWSLSAELKWEARVPTACPSSQKGLCFSEERWELSFSLSSDHRCVRLGKSKPSVSSIH